MALPQRIERLTPADADNPSAGAAEIRGLKAFIEDYFHIQDTVSYTVSPFDPEVTSRVNVKEYPYYAVGDGVADDTAAIQAAIDVAGPHTVYVPSGVYKLSGELMILNRTGITLEGPGTLHHADTEPAIEITGSQQIVIRGLTFTADWEDVWTGGVYTSFPTIGIRANYHTATQDIRDIWVDGCTWRNTPNDAIYIGGHDGTDPLAPYGTYNVRLTNNYVDEGLSFLLCENIRGLLIDGLVVRHRNTLPGHYTAGTWPAGSIVQDEDIAVVSGHLDRAENIIVNNVMIDARGTRANPYTGYLKIHIQANTGCIMPNVSLSNIVIKDNIGSIPNIWGWEGNRCSIVVSDQDWEDDSYRYSSFQNVTLNNISLQNSAGVYLTTHDCHISNLNIDTIPADWEIGALVALDTQGARSCTFTNVKIANWLTTERAIALLGDDIRFTGLRMVNCGGGFYNSPNLTVTDFLIENCGGVAEGAFYVAGGSGDGITLRNGIFRDCPNTALLENINNRPFDCILSGVRFTNNGTNTNIWDGRWRISDCIGLSGVGAALSIRSTTGGLLLPAMITTERDAITGAGGVLNGMMIYNSTTSTVQRYINGWGDL